MAEPITDPDPIHLDCNGFAISPSAIERIAWMPIADQLDAGPGTDNGVAASGFRHGHRQMVQAQDHYAICPATFLRRAQAPADLLIALLDAVMHHGCNRRQQLVLFLAGLGALEAIGEFL